MIFDKYKFLDLILKHLPGKQAHFCWPLAGIQKIHIISYSFSTVKSETLSLHGETQQGGAELAPGYSPCAGETDFAAPILLPATLPVWEKLGPPALGLRPFITSLPAWESQIPQLNIYGPGECRMGHSGPEASTPCTRRPRI